MKPYHIKYQHQETANQSEHSLTHRYWLHTSDETKALPIYTHLKRQAAQLKQLIQTQTHPLHDLYLFSDPLRNKKATIFHNNKHTNIIIILDPDIIPGECKENIIHIYTAITSQ